MQSETRSGKKYSFDSIEEDVYSITRKFQGEFRLGDVLEKIKERRANNGEDPNLTKLEHKIICLCLEEMVFKEILTQKSVLFRHHYPFVPLTESERKLLTMKPLVMGHSMREIPEKLATLITQVTDDFAAAKELESFPEFQHQPIWIVRKGYGPNIFRQVQISAFDYKKGEELRFIPSMVRFKDGYTVVTPPEVISPKVEKLKLSSLLSSRTKKETVCERIRQCLESAWNAALEFTNNHSPKN